jgi:radical SAM superfamily enzyme YgiQ (UPF0313 family)
VTPILKAGLRSKLAAGQALVPEAKELLANPAWEEAEARVLIVRLSPFRDVDRSTSHLVLFAELKRALPGLYLDFAFFPSRAERQALREAAREAGASRAALRSESPAEPGDSASREYSWYYGIDSGRGPDHFDLILVSNSFGLELVNLPYLFSTSGLPFRASERRRLDAAGRALPLVIAGGSNASAAGPLVFEDGDSFVDGIFFGEAEGALAPIVQALLEKGRPAAEAFTGFWATGSPKQVERRRYQGSPPPLADQPLLNSAESGTVRLQISSGCPGLCSFCFEGWDRRPYRELPLAEILEAARAMKRRTGADSVDVFSFNFNTHAEVFSLLFELGRVFRRVSFMSQRLDILAQTPLLLAAEMAADKRSFTLGVEGISARMRAFYRKGLSPDDLERIVSLLVTPGVREIKLFYIVSGLETDADIAEFAAFMEGLAAVRATKAPGLRILASAGFLVRIPRTPLQYAPLALDEAALRRVSDRLVAASVASGIDFRLASRFDEYCVDQLLTLRGEALAPWLETVPARGAVYDGALDKGIWASLKAFAEGRGLLGPDFTGEKGADYQPPLAALKGGCALEPGAEILYREYEEAKAGRDKRLSLERHIRPASLEEIDRIARLKAAKAAFKPLLVAVELPDSLSGATESYKAAWVLRRLLAAAPGSETLVFEAKEALFSSGEVGGLPEGFTGKTLYALFGPKESSLAAAAAAAGFPPFAGADGLGKDAAVPASFEVEVFLPDGIPGRDRALARYLAEEKLAFTEGRTETGRAFTIPPKDMKKRIVLAATSEEGAEGSRLILCLGPKARLSPWLKAEAARDWDASPPTVRVRSLCCATKIVGTPMHEQRIGFQ